MILPKKVLIGGKEWIIHTNKNSGGGEFSGSNYKITIGTKYKKEIPNIFLHEILEAIITERCFRYKTYNEPTNEKLLFSFDHAQFVNIVMDLALALKDVL